MDYKVNIEELQETEYLVIPNVISMAEGVDQYGEGKKFWERCERGGAFERLRAVCGSDTIYGLFCNTYDEAANVVSYDYACVNRLKAAPAEFRPLRLRRAKYAVFSCAGKPPMTIHSAYWRFNDVFWGEWLPKTDYKCVIDYDYEPGSAAIELFEPFTPYAGDAPEFSVKIWYPIADK